MISIVIQEHEEVCGNCKHYKQHLVKCEYPGGKGWYLQPTNCGHCVHPRMKKRRPGELACVHYEEGDG